MLAKQEVLRLKIELSPNLFAQSCTLIFMITVSEEELVDYQLTARIATEAFASPEVRFSVERIKWLYESGFENGATVLSLSNNGEKIGQIAILSQDLYLDGEPQSAIQIFDLFILQKYRSLTLIRRLYKEVERVCADRNIRFVIALPNKNSMLLNIRFLKMKPLVWLDIRAGFSFLRPRSLKLEFSGLLRSLTADAAIGLLSNFSTSTVENGLRWDGDALFNRLSDPTCDYALHASADLLLISSPRKTRGINYTLLSGFFARPHAALTGSHVRQLVRTACRFWKAPLFIYVGVNSQLPELPGFKVPPRVRSPMLVQLRDLRDEWSNARFDRFQLVDCDFV